MLEKVLKAILRHGKIWYRMVCNFIDIMYKNDRKGLISGLDDYDERQKERWRSSAKIVLYDNDEQALEFVKAALAGFSLDRKLYFGRIGSTLAKRIKDVTGYNISGRNLTLRAGNIRKINADHGSEKREMIRGQRAITDADYLLIPIIVSQPDEVYPSPKEYLGKPVLMFEKVVDGSRITIVAVDSGGSYDLFIQTMYAEKRA